MNNKKDGNSFREQELTLEQLEAIKGGHNGGQYDMHFQPNGTDIIGNRDGYFNGSPSEERTENGNTP